MGQAGEWKMFACGTMAAAQGMWEVLSCRIEKRPGSEDGLVGLGTRVVLVGLDGIVWCD
jgi:hypothetical protein